jgi:hypothetical protein
MGLTERLRDGGDTPQGMPVASGTGVGISSLMKPSGVLEALPDIPALCSWRACHKKAGQSVERGVRRIRTATGRTSEVKD